ncbi:MAG: hypothetical protein GX804_08655 [Lentisphaerae bacterium]|nr:hypothetical protein [Lentisphaerota bacterium]
MKILEHIEAELQKQSVALALYAVRHDNRTPVEEITVPLCDNVEFTLGNARFCVRLFATPATFGGTLLDIHFKILSGTVDNASLGVCAEFTKWSRDEWVFMPACVYAGNRFRRVTPEDMQNPAPDPESWVTLTRDLGLNPGDGASRIQVLAGDCAAPCAGILSPSAQRGLLLLSTQGSGYGDLGIHVEENETRSHARLLFKSPGVREGAKYNVANSRFRDADAGACFSGGDSLTLPLLVHTFPATTPEALYKHFVRLRKTFGPHRERHDLPFETAFRLIEEKHNRENWIESYGYWSVGMRESLPQDWQSGWVGGPNTMWPLFLRGDACSTGRALRVWDFVAEHAVTPSGFLKGSFTKGDWGNAPERCYMRYSADTLYFLMKTLLHLRVGPPHIEPNETWLSLARGLCKAFTGCWEESGHLPHYADARTGHVIVGGSCAAALAPAGLALAARYFDEPGYRTVAESAARRYRDNFLAKGITNGGPGDIRQNVDSESAAALLESFIILMEESDGAPEWVDAAVRAAAYCATWVTSYDFCFPPASTFGQLDMLTTGTVWANVQNKHAAPGICTL